MRRHLSSLSLRALAILASVISFASGGSPQSRLNCQAPEYFGICDPFVAGTLIASQGDNQPLLVVDTWPSGPAEKAGICPGDEIVSINGVSAFHSTYERMLREIISERPSSLDLEIRRGNQELRFRILRARESTLALLNKQKFMYTWEPFTARLTLSLVPTDQTQEGLEQLKNFRKRIDGRYGFKWVENLAVPTGTPQEQAIRVSELMTTIGHEASPRLLGRTRHYTSSNGYSVGFRALALRDPPQVLIGPVLQGSTAHGAGLLPGDEIIEIDGRSVSGLTLPQLQELILKPDERRRIAIKLRRGKSVLNVAFETERQREFSESNLHTALPDWSGSPRGDAYIYGLSALHAEDPREAIVAAVECPSPAFDAGIQPGDLISALNGTAITRVSRQQLREFLTPSGRSKISLEVVRSGRTLNFEVNSITYKEALARIGRKLTSHGPVPQNCLAAGP